MAPYYSQGWSSAYHSHSSSRSEPYRDNHRFSGPRESLEGGSGRERRKERQKASRHDDTSDTSAKTEATVKNPSSLKVEAQVDNSELLGGLAWQRKCDEKPDIDTLANSLLQLYCDVTRHGDEAFDNPELMDRIYLTGLRLKAKTESQFNGIYWKLLATLKYSQHLILKHRNIQFNLPHTESLYIGLCRDSRRGNGYERLYEKIAKIVAKIPPVANLEATTQETARKRDEALKQVKETTAIVKEYKRQIQAANKCLGLA